MTCTLTIASHTNSDQVLGTRHSAISLRERVEERLESCEAVHVDFDGLFVTQSFVDELFGPLILRMGPTVLQRLVFLGCSEDTQAILKLVFASRIKDFSSRQLDQCTAAI
ncbi:MAG: hypothetical protein JWO52_3163 [Gammaproteobacteria bacterium]|jgi:hypothetical protein|nr:hypothetical protein [Gammaproteobacteria bacterium]